MRRDPATARLRALSALLGCALLLWLLALLGLGGWAGEGEAGVPAPWTLPQREAAAERLDTPDAYAEIGARPLFSAGRRPQPFVLDADGDASASGPEFVLTGVLMTSTLNVAILTPGDGGEPVQVHPGEGLPGRPDWQLHSLAPRHALFQTPDGLIRFDLRGIDADAAPLVPELTAPVQAEEADQGALNGSVHNQEHQARIEAIRRRVAERRAQQRDEQAVLPHSNQ